MPANESTVYIIDDDEAVRDSLHLLLQAVGQPAVTFSSARDFLAAYHEQLSGCIVLDIRMPDMSGLELQALLKQRHCFLPIIFITGHGDIPIAVQALKEGALDFLQKPFEDQALLELIRKALELDNTRRTASLAIKEILGRITALTKREREILQHVIAGKANKVIAADIHLSQRTVEIHRARVMEKMQAKSLAHLVRQVIQVKPYLNDRLEATAPRP
jgi:FixJ family two-component response regulator